MKRCLLALWLSACAGAASAALDLESLWDPLQPAASEARMRTALLRAKGDDALILRTQIARSLAQRGRTEEAHRELDIVEPLLPSAAGVEPRVRTLLERGRVLRVARHPVQARPLFMLAFEAAAKARLEALAADALGMVALVEPGLDAKLEWQRRRVAYARAARAPQAGEWEAGALHDLGLTLGAAGRRAEAREAFRDEAAARERTRQRNGG